MDDVIQEGGEKLISTTRASEISGYSKDYIGQLCREEKLECRRVSGQWYLHEGSLREYQGVGGVGVQTPHFEKGALDEEGQSSEDSSKKSSFSLKVGNVRNDTFAYDGQEFISTARASEVTGYTQDYVGQLARGGEVIARKVGRRWFVARQSLLNHKKENDAMLASVQSQASGLGGATGETVSKSSEEKNSGKATTVHIQKQDQSSQRRACGARRHKF